MGCTSFFLSLGGSGGASASDEDTESPNLSYGASDEGTESPKSPGWTTTSCSQIVAMLIIFELLPVAKIEKLSRKCGGYTGFVGSYGGQSVWAS